VKRLLAATALMLGLGVTAAGAVDKDGAFGNDRLLGGPGNDELVAPALGGDFLECGPGRDIAYVSPGDRTRGCERRINPL
jgi:Ca2+-binding RTX toxin-like protein